MVAGAGSQIQAEIQVKNSFRGQILVFDGPYPKKETKLVTTNRLTIK